MHSGASFNLRCVTYDKRRKDKTGRILEINEGQLIWGDGGNGRAKKKSERQPTALERSMMSTQDAAKRDPKHQVHYTRNIRILMDGQPTESKVKIHPPLIIEFNGQTVTP